jgi:tetratricopeptide (TPR) repeat protein
MATAKQLLLVPVSLLTCALLSLSCGGPDAEDQYRAGLALMEQEQWEEAIVELEAASSAFLDNAGYRRISGDYELAKAITVMHADALVQISVARTELGQHQMALDALKRAVHIDSDYAIAYANRAVVHTRLGMDAEAEEDVAKAEERGYDIARLKQDIEDVKKAR